MSQPAAAEPSSRYETLARYCVWAVAAAVAIASARDYAGGWNDGSRLATVECLVDYHTLAIDDSIFVKVPPTDFSGTRPFPYLVNDPNAWIEGTKDKILVNGHFYSHRSPLPAVLLAGWYFVWQQCTGFTAKDRCDEFCYWMNLGSAGLCYVIAVICTYYLGSVLKLPLGRRLALTASLALASVALPYACHVNDHIMLLGVAAALALSLARLAEKTTIAERDSASGWPIQSTWKALLTAGSFAGLGYTIDQGAGPPLLFVSVLLIAYRTRFHLASLATLIAAASPWVIAHHALNYAIGGTLKPIGSMPEYFNWPGTPFNSQNMTGIWNHPSLVDFLRYALGLLFEPPWGFFWHNLPLLLTISGAFVTWRKRPQETPELAALGAWAVMTWLLYAALSVNHSGDCCSVRWFVPLLAAGYYLLAVLVRDHLRYNFGFLALTAIGIGLAACMWQAGPWEEPNSPLFKQLQLAGAIAWLAWLGWAAVARAKGDRAMPPRKRRKVRG
jgi:hypothetical protein